MANPTVLLQDEFQILLNYYEEGGRAGVTLVDSDNEWHYVRNVADLKRLANAWKLEIIGFQTHSPKVYRELAKSIGIERLVIRDL